MNTTFDIEITSKGTKTVKRDIESLGKSVKSTESLVDQLNNTFKTSSSEQLKKRLDSLNTSFKNGKTPLKDYQSQLAGISKDAKSLGISLDGAKTKLGKFSKEAKESSNVLKTVSKFASFALLSAGLSSATSSTIEYKNALSEVSTLLDGNIDSQISNISQLAKEQVKQFGGLPTEQVKSFYQIISAGASSAGEANAILTASNKLAVGGVTDVTIAADGLTSVLNAYGLEADKSTNITDSMFVAMKAGKTTISELSSSLGLVAPLAVSAGVEFDELTSSIAALTKGGINTKVAVTGVRAILAAIAKPTAEASEIANKLGIEFNSAGLKAKGFQGFLQELQIKTRGNSDSLAKLFGGVEALVPILALTGKSSKDFTTILESMNLKAGSTEQAFTKMANSPGFQIGRLFSAIKVEVISLSDSFVNLLGKSAKFLANNFQTIIKVLKVFSVTALVAFGPALLGVINSATAATIAFNTALLANPIVAITATLVALTTALVAFSDQINLTSDGTIKLKDVFDLAFSKIGDAIQIGIDLFRSFANFVSSKIQENKQLFETLGNSIRETIKNTINFVINSFIAGYNSIAKIWSNLPDFFISIVELSVNGALGGLEQFINKFAGVLQNLGSKFGIVDLQKDFKVKFAKINLTKEGENIGESIYKAILSQLNTDQIAKIKNRIISNKRNSQVKNSSLINSSKSTINNSIVKNDEINSSKNKTVQKENDELQKQNEFIKNLNSKFSEQIKILKTKKEEKSKLKEVINLENQFTKVGISLDDQRYTNALSKLNQIITLKEQQKQQENQSKFNSSLQSENEKLQFQIQILSMEKESRDALIVTRKLENEAKKLGVTVSQEEINKRIQLNSQLKEEQELQQFKAGILQQITSPQDVYNEKVGKLNELLNAGQLSLEQYNAALGVLKENVTSNSETFGSGFNSAIQGMTMTVQDFGNELGNTISGTFQGMEDNLVSLVTTGKADWAGMVDSMISDLARLMIKMLIIQPLMSGFGGGLFGGAFAKGAAFSGGKVTPFAKGGLVNSPTLFPMAKGMGLMGEAGPEAVVPLARTSSGDLGIQTTGAIGNNAVQTNVFSPTINVTVEGGSKGQKEDQNLGENVSNQINSILQNKFAEFVQTQKRNGGMLSASN